MRIRPPRDEDAEAVLAVCVARDIADIGRPDFTLEDVRADWATPGVDPERDCFVVEDDDAAIVAYALIDHRAAMVSVHPEAEGRGIGTMLREALEARAAERGQPPRQMVTASNTAAVELLSNAGYRRAHVYRRLAIADLTQAPPAPEGPAPRRFDLATEAQAMHQLVEAAFAEIPGNVHEPFDSWLAYVERTSEPAYRLAIDDGDGLAAAIIGERWERDEGDLGYVAMIAVAPRARGRGYGRILLLALLDAFRADGLCGAELSVAGANAPATGLYESVGMTESFRQERWER